MGHTNLYVASKQSLWLKTPASYSLYGWCVNSNPISGTRTSQESNNSRFHNLLSASTKPSLSE